MCHNREESVMTPGEKILESLKSEMKTAKALVESTRLDKRVVAGAILGLLQSCKIIREGRQFRLRGDAEPLPWRTTSQSPEQQKGYSDEN